MYGTDTWPHMKQRFNFSSGVHFQYCSQLFYDSEDDWTVSIMVSLSEVFSMVLALEAIGFECNLRDGSSHYYQYPHEQQLSPAPCAYV